MLAGILFWKQKYLVLWDCAYKLGMRGYLTVLKSSGSNHRLYFLCNKPFLNTAHFKGKFTIFPLYSVHPT